MTRIPPIPTTRVSDMFARQRLTEQTQADQIDLFRLQNQISTGRRIVLPSEDAPAALRAMNLQRLLERKEQVQQNLEGSNSFLSGTDTAMASLSGQLIDIRAATVGVVDSAATDDERQAVMAQVDRALEQIVSTGNLKFRDRYLFAGSRSLVEPYTMESGYVEYNGNEQNLRSYVDVSLLFDTNIPGTEVFGGISAGVEGSVDLNPRVTPETLLRDINQGRGLGPGRSIALDVSVSGVSEAAVIDLSKAVTVSDVARLIEDQAPPVGEITVDVSGTGFTIQSAVGANIFVNEVASGTTARELGIFTGNATLVSQIDGDDLNPLVHKTTRLDDLLGTRSVGRLEPGGANNDLILTATVNGDFNDVDVILVDAVGAGSETATYDSFAKLLTVNIQSGVTTAAQAAAAIDAEGTFTAAIDKRDALSLVEAGSGAVSAQLFSAVTTGGSGVPLDLDSGLVVTNGDDSQTIDTSEAETVEDLLNLLNTAGLGLLAVVNQAGDGIQVRSRRSGVDLTIGENGGTTASQLGIRTYTTATRLAELNRGTGVPTIDGEDLIITATDGTAFGVDLSAAVTVGDVLEQINSHPDNLGLVTARLATTGNGIEIADLIGGPQDLLLAAAEGSQAADYLGFLPGEATSVSSSTGTLQSEDRRTYEVDSVFNTLFRLREALDSGDAAQIGRELERLDDDLFRANFARSEVGARQQSLDALRIRLEDEDVQLRDALSREIDVDLVEAISNLSQRQLALEASLRTTASILQLTLLNFI